MSDRPDEHPSHDPAPEHDLEPDRPLVLAMEAPESLPGRAMPVDEPTAIVAAEPEASHPASIAPEPLSHAMLEDEPTTIVAAEPEASHPASMTHEPLTHAMLEDEPTTIVAAEPEAGHPASMTHEPLTHAMLEDEPTTIVAAEPEAGHPASIAPEPLSHAMLEDEPTTIVAAEPEAGHPASIAPEPLSHAMLEDEPTTILTADPGQDEDEPTSIVTASARTREPEQEPAAAHAVVPLRDAGTSIPTATIVADAQAEPAWPHILGEEPTTLFHAPDEEDGEYGEATEIRLLPSLSEAADGASPGPDGPVPSWFDGRLQEFTTALQQDEAGRPRPPQERQMLAASARDMIARVAMHRARATEGWAADTVLQPDQLLANTYIVRSLIARGGVGEIYRTRHRDLKTEHAVKILLPRYALDATLLTMMLDEARLLQCVRHEAVVGCQDLLRDADGRPMIVMDYLRGRTLSSRLREGRLSPTELIVLARRLADGLSAIHAAGIVHQDISPDNVILTDDSCAAATIIDFGLARSLGSVRDTHRNLDFAGKFSWSSPEQLSGRVTAIDARSDLYSLGLMLAAAARGYRLDMGTDLESARAARTTVPSLAGIEEPIAGLLQVLLAPSPSARLGSPAEIHAMLTPRPPTILEKLQKLLGL